MKRTTGPDRRIFRMIAESAARRMLSESEEFMVGEILKNGNNRLAFGAY